MPDIVIRNAENQEEVWRDVNTVRFLNEEGGLVSYEYNPGEVPTEESPNLLPAPDGKVWVGFVDGHGDLLWNTLIDEGGSCEYPKDSSGNLLIPDPPEDDMEFVKWRWTLEELQNVESDTVVAPVWKYKGFDITDTVIKINTFYAPTGNYALNLHFSNYDNETVTDATVTIDWGDGSDATILTFGATKTYLKASHTIAVTDYDNIYYIKISMSGTDYVNLGYSTSYTNYGDNRDLYNKYVTYATSFVTAGHGDILRSILGIQFGANLRYLDNKSLSFSNATMFHLTNILIESDYLECYVFADSNIRSLTSIVLPNIKYLTTYHIRNILCEQNQSLHTLAFGKSYEYVLYNFYSSTVTIESKISTYLVNNFGIARGENIVRISQSAIRHIKYLTIPWTYKNIVTYADFPKNTVKFIYFTPTGEISSYNHLYLDPHINTFPNLYPDDITLYVTYFSVIFGFNTDYAKRPIKCLITINRNYDYGLGAYKIIPNNSLSLLHDIDLTNAEIKIGSWSNDTFTESTLSAGTYSYLCGVLANLISLNYDKITHNSGVFMAERSASVAIKDITMYGDLSNAGTVPMYGSSAYNSYYIYKIPISINIPDSTTLPFYISNFIIKSINIPKVTTFRNNTVFKECTFLTDIVVAEGTTTLGSYFLSSCVLNALYLPSTLTSINTPFIYKTFKYNYVSSEISSTSDKITDLYIKATTPPTLSSASLVSSWPSTLADAKKHDKQITIHIPKGSLSAYQSATNWSAYKYSFVEDIDVSE